MTAHAGVRNGIRWREADCLIELEHEVDAAHPVRLHTIDGTIGDAAHAGRRSDHNPDSAGIVCAIDFTHDPVHFDSYKFADWLANEIARGAEKRISGIGSWNVTTQRERWFSRHNGVLWSWLDQDLSGASHRGHVHVGCSHIASAYTGMGQFGYRGYTGPGAPPVGTTPPLPAPKTVPITGSKLMRTVVSVYTDPSGQGWTHVPTIAPDSIVAVWSDCNDVQRDLKYWPVGRVGAHPSAKGGTIVVVQEGAPNSTMTVNVSH